MRARVGDIKQLIREELELSEGMFGGGNKLNKLLDAVMSELQDVNKKLEVAHKLAPAGAAKAIVMGLHSDIFNKIADFRKYICQVKQNAM